MTNTENRCIIEKRRNQGERGENHEREAQTGRAGRNRKQNTGSTGGKAGGGSRQGSAGSPRGGNGRSQGGRPRRETGSPGRSRGSGTGSRAGSPGRKTREGPGSRDERSSGRRQPQRQRTTQPGRERQQRQRPGQTRHTRNTKPARANPRPWGRAETDRPGEPQPAGNPQATALTTLLTAFQQRPTQLRVGARGTKQRHPTKRDKAPPDHAHKPGPMGPQAASTGPDRAITDPLQDQQPVRADPQGGGQWGHRPGETVLWVGRGARQPAPAEGRGRRGRTDDI